MKTLIIDTSSSILYVSFYEDHKKCFEKMIEGKNNHSENLIPTITEGLKELNLEVKDLNRIICGIGPGSYTGLRVSLTVAKTFSWTLQIPLFIVSSLDILGSGYFEKDGLYAITSYAKKNHVYAKLVEIKNGIQNIIINDSFLEEKAFLELIKDYRYQLINETNYAFNPTLLNLKAVEDIHLLTPNYLQKEQE